MATKDTIRSLRISATLDRDLRELAKQRQTSVNSLAESALAKFVDFDSHTGEFDYVTVKKAFLAKVLEFLSDEEASELGGWAASGPGSETVRYYYPKADLDALLSTYRKIGGGYARMFTFRHEAEGSQHTIMVTHNMGMKWSLFYEANMKTLFEKALGVKLVTELSDNMVTARFRK